MTLCMDSETSRTEASSPWNGHQHNPGPAQGRPDLYCPGDVNLLVIDDDEGICQVAQAVLASQNFHIDTVSDPERIEAQLQAKPYQVIILDYMLPPLESEQVLGWIKEHQPAANIIVVTAYPSTDSAVNCLRARTYDYITKPFQVAHLQRVVMRCLESQGLLRMTEQALRVSLGMAIRERRKALDLTLADMARKTGVSLGYLSQIELGKNSASIETLYRISLGLGLRMADLFQAVHPSL